MKLNSKRIVITGGTSGIGYEVVKQLYANNEILVIGRDKAKLFEITETFQGIRTCQADLTKLDEVKEAANYVSGYFSHIDVLINNAGVQYTPAFLDDDFNYESINREITLNFTSICCLSYLLLPALLHNHTALIVNVGSGLGMMPKTSSAIYCATKGALNIFSRSLRYQLEDSNIRVLHAIMPLVETSMTKGRGRGKITASRAAMQLINGMEKEIPEHDIGKVKLLRLLLRLAPGVARKIMRAG